VGCRGGVGCGGGGGGGGGGGVEGCNTPPPPPHRGLGKCLLDLAIVFGFIGKLFS
jgi:hypothetical protein